MNIDNLEFYDGGDSVEYEVWQDKTTKKLYRVSIEIVRDFSEAKEVESLHEAKFGDTVKKSNTAIDLLTEDQRSSLEAAKNKVTIEMLNALDYGEDIDLNELFVLSHYCEDEIVVINLKAEWNEILQVQWSDDDIIFEEL